MKNINIIIKILLSQKQDPSYCLPLYHDQLLISSLQMLEDRSVSVPDLSVLISNWAGGGDVRAVSDDILQTGGGV